MKDLNNEGTPGDKIDQLDRTFLQGRVEIVIRICKDCKYICKPCGALYEPHPESICLATDVLDYVTGEKKHFLCKDQNQCGYCGFFEVKE